MKNKERLNEKVAHTEKILKWIKVLNDTDDHKQLENAIWFLKHFTQDIEYLYSERNEKRINTPEYKAKEEAFIKTMNEKFISENF